MASDTWSTLKSTLFSNYVDNYLDSVENLPDDVQRHLSRIREIDVLYRNHLRDVSIYYEQWNGSNGTNGSSQGSQLNGGVGGSGAGGGGAGSDSSSAATAPASDQPSQASKRAMVRMQQGLIAAQELGDEKLQIVQHLQDLIDHKTRQLDQDFKNLGSDFFSRMDYGREEKLSEQKEIRTTSPGSACSPNNVNSVPSVFAPATGNGQSVSGTGTGSCGNGGTGNGAVTPNNASGGSASFSTSSANNNTNNGNGSGGNGSGTASTTGGSGVVGATASGSGGNGSGNGGTATERGSKRARRTRNEQTGAGANNGSSTPNSTSGALQMEVDPIDTSNIKQEVVSTSGGSGQTSGSAAVGASGSGTSSGKAGGSGSAGAGASGASGSGAAGSSQAASGGQGKKGGAAAGGKKKKRKAGGRGQAREAREDTPPPEETIDPDEPTYCLCDQISFGEMILCDNDLCPIEWFHFSCVALMSKPKGKWFCPNCRGDRPNVMKPKAQFLKELERYNKEKEEKT